jgi:hypothetical protein
MKTRQNLRLDYGTITARATLLYRTATHKTGDPETKMVASLAALARGGSGQSKCASPQTLGLCLE